MVKYIVRKFDKNKSTSQNFVYQYSSFLHDGDSRSARRWLDKNLDDLFLDVDPLLIEFRPLGQKSWRGYLRVSDIPEEEYPITIEEYEEENPLPKNSKKYLMGAFVLTTGEEDGMDGFYAHSYFLAPSLDEAIKKAERTGSIELDTREGFLRLSTLRVKKVGRKEKWNLVKTTNNKP